MNYLGLHKKNKMISLIIGNSPGFTLIELMVVAAIIFIAIAVAAPSTLTWLRDRGVHDAAKQLGDDLQRAKLLAIKESNNCSITFNLPGPNQYTISLSNEVMDLGRFTGGVSFTNNPVPTDPVITFTPQGICTPSGAALLTNQSNSITYRIRTTGAGGISTQILGGGVWH